LAFYRPCTFRRGFPAALYSVTHTHTHTFSILRLSRAPCIYCIYSPVHPLYTSSPIPIRMYNGRCSWPRWTINQIRVVNENCTRKRPQSACIGPMYTREEQNKKNKNTQIYKYDIYKRKFCWERENRAHHMYILYYVPKYSSICAWDTEGPRSFLAAHHAWYTRPKKNFSEMRRGERIRMKIIKWYYVSFVIGLSSRLSTHIIDIYVMVARDSVNNPQVTAGMIIWEYNIHRYSSTRTLIA